jgi:hypothetical protein
VPAAVHSEQYNRQPVPLRSCASWQWPCRSTRRQRRQPCSRSCHRCDCSSSTRRCSSSAGGADGLPSGPWGLRRARWVAGRADGYGAGAWHGTWVGATSCGCWRCSHPCQHPGGLPGLLGTSTQQHIIRRGGLSVSSASAIVCVLMVHRLSCQQFVNTSRRPCRPAPHKAVQQLVVCHMLGP